MMYNRIAFLVVVTTLLTAIVSIAPFNSKNANAQGGSSQNQTGMMIGANVTSSIPLNHSTSPKAIISQVHVSLVDASTTAEKSVGTNAHSVAVRIGAVNGHLVYTTLVYDMNTDTLHGVLVDPGNGKVISSIQFPAGALGATMGPGMAEQGSSHP